MCAGVVGVWPGSSLHLPVSPPLPLLGLTVGRFESGAMKAKTNTVSASETGFSNSLHFLSHKICKNNAIIFIFKIQL